MLEWSILSIAMLLSAGLGWYWGRRKYRKADNRQENRFSNRYFRGLNYLLNEQPDKAIEVFLQLAEVNQDTVETHFALGNLFRRRGEVDRAIRFHQNIIAKPTLTERQRTRALLELGDDYMRAGLLDRAERLFSELVERDAHTPAALQHLLAIYQQEQDWNKAIDIATRLEHQEGSSMGPIRAHFCCELAEESASHGKTDEAIDHLRKALDYNKSCVRARFIEARLREQQQDYSAAIGAYKAALELDKAYLPEILNPLLRCMQAEGQDDQIEGMLRGYADSYDGVTAILALAQSIEGKHGREEAIDFLAGKLQQRPTVRGLEYLIDMNAAAPNSDDDTNLSILRDLSRKLLIKQPTYRCEHCGFSGQQHHWQCPSCKFWDSTKRIRGVTGE